MSLTIINKYNLPDEMIRDLITSYERKSGRVIVKAEFILADGNIDELYTFWEPESFVRVRRITGYLAVTTKWNNAKRAELADRTKNKLTEDIE